MLETLVVQKFFTIFQQNILLQTIFWELKDLTNPKLSASLS